MPLSAGHGAQAAHEEQELLGGRLAFLGHQPVGGLEHHRARGVAVVVDPDPAPERGQRLGLGDHVETATLRQLQVDVGERLEP